MSLVEFSVSLEHDTIGETLGTGVLPNGDHPALGWVQDFALHTAWIDARQRDAEETVCVEPRVGVGEVCGCGGAWEGEVGGIRLGFGMRLLRSSPSPPPPPPPLSFFPFF